MVSGLRGTISKDPVSESYLENALLASNFNAGNEVQMMATLISTPDQMTRLTPSTSDGEMNVS